MTTKEIEHMLEITKATLIYYEKEGFIKPERGKIIMEIIHRKI